MKNKFLIAGFASLSLLVAAQTQSNTDQKQQPAAAHEVKAPRDAATGQASGRRMNQKAESDGVVHRDLAAREASSGQASGKRAAGEQGGPKMQTVSADADADGSADRKTGTGYNVKNQTKRVAAGDVNGDGVDATAQAGAGSSDAVSKHEVKSPRDVATGQASGKRQHTPVKSEQSGAKPENK